MNIQFHWMRRTPYWTGPHRKRDEDEDATVQPPGRGNKEEESTSFELRLQGHVQRSYLIQEFSGSRSFAMGIRLRKLASRPSRTSIVRRSASGSRSLSPCQPTRDSLSAPSSPQTLPAASRQVGATGAPMSLLQCRPSSCPSRPPTFSCNSSFTRQLDLSVSEHRKRRLSRRTRTGFVWRARACEPRD